MIRVKRLQAKDIKPGTVQIWPPVQGEEVRPMRRFLEAKIQSPWVAVKWQDIDMNRYREMSAYWRQDEEIWAIDDEYIIEEEP